MTTVVPFTPSITPGQPPFSFQATFDGSLYNCTVFWLLQAQRWYVQVQDQDGNTIVFLPMTGSSDASPLQSVSWDVGTGNGGIVTAITAAPHNFKLGMIVLLNITGCVPNGYNVLTPVQVIGPSTFTYPLAQNPGTATVAGRYSFDINLLRGYFASTLVWRVNSGNIEISP